MRLEKAQYTARAHTTCIFVLLPRFLVVLPAAGKSQAFDAATGEKRS